MVEFIYFVAAAAKRERTKNDVGFYRALVVKKLAHWSLVTVSNAAVKRRYSVSGTCQDCQILASTLTFFEIFDQRASTVFLSHA